MISVFAPDSRPPPQNASKERRKKITKLQAESNKSENRKRGLYFSVAFPNKRKNAQNSSTLNKRGGACNMGALNKN